MKLVEAIVFFVKTASHGTTSLKADLFKNTGVPCGVPLEPQDELCFASLIFDNLDRMHPVAVRAPGYYDDLAGYLELELANRNQSTASGLFPNLGALHEPTRVTHESISLLPRKTARTLRSSF
jgi:hypothetical protein